MVPATDHHDHASTLHDGIDHDHSVADHYWFDNDDPAGTDHTSVARVELHSGPEFVRYS